MDDFFNQWVRVFVPRLMKDFDLDLLSSCAVFGNAGHESNGFKSLQELKPLVPGSKGGYGIMQWTGPRRREYESYCSRNKLNPADMESNYKFLFVELKGPEGRVIPKLKATVGLDKKTEVFMKTFLRPGIPHLDSRIVWAKRAYEAVQDANVVPKVESTVPVFKPPYGPDSDPINVHDTGPKKSILVTLIDWLIDAIFRKN